MQFSNLGENVQIKRISEDTKEGVFEIEGLYTGYGITVGNSLRRVLLSSLPGAAITQVKIKGVGHEFTTIPHVMEDVVEIAMNLKKIRFRLYTDETQTLTLKVKGENVVTAGDIEINANVEVITPDAHIATISAKSGELEMEFTVERGLGYVPVEARKLEKLAIGVVALDAIFTPVTRVSYSVENMRVADRTDYNRLRLVIETDGSITPSAALVASANILQEHFAKLIVLDVKVIEGEKAEPKKKTKKTKK
ncbi:MAG: DNA-directed RNA polymerase subunit alpha [bacterium]|nr:DNA-directed RNA polymerase subunit alpha [bacterium]